MNQPINEVQAHEANRKRMQDAVVALMQERDALKAAVAELNERLHERTQGFLRRAAADRGEQAKKDEGGDNCFRAYCALLWEGVLNRQCRSPLQAHTPLELEEVLESLEAQGVDEGMLDGIFEGVEALPWVVRNCDLKLRDVRHCPLTDAEEESGEWMKNSGPSNEAAVKPAPRKPGALIKDSLGMLNLDGSLPRPTPPQG